jgi:hypothetical protein
VIKSLWTTVLSGALSYLKDVIKKFWAYIMPLVAAAIWGLFGFPLPSNSEEWKNQLLELLKYIWAVLWAHPVFFGIGLASAAGNIVLAFLLIRIKFGPKNNYKQLVEQIGLSGMWAHARIA